MGSKSIENLPADIYQLFNPEIDHQVSEENLNHFLSSLGDLVRTRLSKRKDKEFYLRFSGLGKPDRQVWYDSRGYEGEKFLGQTYLKFLYGDIIECLLLLLAREAGYEVTDEQKEVDCLGVKGHLDAKIEGVVTDVKSASPFGFKKFKDHTLFEDDPFGYIPQISGYVSVETPGEAGAFLACDKVSGDVTVMSVPSSIVKDNLPAPRIEHLREVISSDTPPPRCFPDEPDGKSGNRKLGTECSYCAHKFSCWPGVRTFLYSTGPRYLTHVERVPEVYELKHGNTKGTTMEEDVSEA
jgi:hypothetical protein